MYPKIEINVETINEEWKIFKWVENKISDNNIAKMPSINLSNKINPIKHKTTERI